MAVLHNLDPFDAVRIFYGGKTDGFSEEDFEANIKTRDIILPAILRRFLREYGYMTVNRQSDAPRFIHPNIMTKRVFRYGEDKEMPLLIIGRVGEFEITIVDEQKIDDPAVFLMKTTPTGTQLMPSDDTLSELIKVMFCMLVLKSGGAVIADEPELAVRLLRENGFDPELIENNEELHREYSIGFAEELRTFMVAEFSEGELARFFFLRNESFVNSNDEQQ
ncbi:MAG: hypothetical protein K2J77_06655 [Oscillospiraceae bacterium]|nr:hypothetical protein [Oscillospiraceae bacterium]